MSKIFMQPGQLLPDALGRTSIQVPEHNFGKELAVLTCASAGWEDWLIGCWNALNRNSPSSDELPYDFFVMNLGNSDSIAQLCQQYGWNEIKCHCITNRMGTQSKAVLYSSSRVLPHKKFICIDSDWFAMTSIKGLVDLIDANPEKTGICVDHGWIVHGVRADAEPKQFYQAVRSLYRADPEPFVYGMHPRVYGNHMVINDGLFVGDKWALANLDAGIRKWQRDNAPKMGPGTWGLNQGICNAVLCDTLGGFIMPSEWNTHLQAPSCKAVENVTGIPTFTDQYLRKYYLLDKPFESTPEEIRKLPRYDSETQIWGLHFAGARGKRSFKAVQEFYKGGCK